jgi:PAS domain S-box-containing protein
MPMRDESGEVEAVLGVDYDAKNWISASLIERFFAFVLAFILVIILMANVTILSTIGASETKFKTLANHAPVGIFLTDSRGKCVFVNNRWCEISGYSLKEAAGEGWVRAVHPEDRKMVLDRWQETVKTGREFILEYRFQAPSGQVAWLFATAITLHNETGEISGYLGTITDFTEHKKLEKEREKLIKDLQEALSKVKTLSGLLPICASCKKIRDDKGYWNQIEVYVKDRSDAEFSHGICPDCKKQLYPNL